MSPRSWPGQRCLRGRKLSDLKTGTLHLQGITGCFWIRPSHKGRGRPRYTLGTPQVQRSAARGAQVEKLRPCSSFQAAFATQASLLQELVLDRRAFRAEVDKEGASSSASPQLLELVVVGPLNVAPLLDLRRGKNKLLGEQPCLVNWITFQSHHWAKGREP